MWDDNGYGPVSVLICIDAEVGDQIAGFVCRFESFKGDILEEAIAQRAEHSLVPVVSPLRQKA